jgi:hypothetical protein
MSLLVLLFLTLTGQTFHLTGRVVSDTGAPIPQAVVSIHASPPIRVITDASGAFILDLPIEGIFVADIGATGFFSATDQTVPRPPEEWRIVLSPIRDFAESVSVSPRGGSGGSPLDLDQNGAQQTLSGAELLNVPFTGSGSVKAGMATLTGVVSDAYGGIHVNGGPESETVFLLDGFNISDPLTGTVDPRVTIEAVRSIAVLSGPYSAEYGRGSAGVVDIVTNTGSDRLRVSATDFVPTLSYEKRIHIDGWSPRLTVSGPLVPGRAWFTNGLTSEYAQYVVNELPDGADTTTGYRISDYAHVQVNLAPSNILYAGALVSVGATDRVGLGPLDPASTTLDYRNRQWLTNLRDQQFLRSGLAFEIGYGSNRTSLREQPQGHAPFVSTPLGRRGNSYIDTTQHASRDEVLASVSLPTLGSTLGTHQLKTGVSLDRRGYDQDAQRGTLSLLDARLQPIRTMSFEGSGVLATSAFDAAMYVQDAWRVRADTLVQFGVRADRSGLVRGWSASPRVGIAWSPRALLGGGHGDMKLSGGYAVTHDIPRLQLFTAPADQTPVSIFFPPYDSGTQSVRTHFLIPDALDSPLTQTVSIAWDQRLAANVLLRVQGLSRRQDHGLAYVGTPYTDRDTTYTLANQRTEAYDALDVSARQTFAKQYGWMAGYTRSSARSNAVLRIGPDDYFFTTDNQGPLSWDAPHRFVSWAYLPTFREPWAFATLLDYRTGFPFSAANSAGAVALPVNHLRFPNYFSLNVDLERKIRFRGNLWALRAGLVNVTNHFNPDTVNAITDSAAFLQMSGGQRRLLEFRVRWLGRLKSP